MACRFESGLRHQPSIRVDLIGVNLRALPTPTAQALPAPPRPGKILSGKGSVRRRAAAAQARVWFDSRQADPYSFGFGRPPPRATERGRIRLARRSPAGVRKTRLMLENYLPILLFAVIALGLGAVMILVGAVLGPHRPDADKLSPYECGFEAFEDSRMKFDVRYYLVAILFIIFDLEIAFLFPWAVVLDQIGLFGFTAMMVFLAVLVIGFIYEWKKGALEWE